MEKTVRKLSFAILKPHKPGLVEFTNTLSALQGVDGVKLEVQETDKSTETVYVSMEGKLNYSAIKSAIEENGGVIHSLNTVVAGKLLGE